MGVGSIYESTAQKRGDMEGVSVVKPLQTFIFPGRHFPDNNLIGSKRGLSVCEYILARCDVVFSFALAS